MRAANARCRRLNLAAELGAETVTLAGDDAVATLIGYAQARNVSKLVAGASARRGRRALAAPAVRRAHSPSAPAISISR